jgi:hypothetical protein
MPLAEKKITNFMPQNTSEIIHLTTNKEQL